MSGELLPPPGDTEKHLVDYVRESESARKAFLEKAKTHKYSNSPDVTGVAVSGSEVLNSFSHELRYILEMEDADPRSKGLMIYDAQKTQTGKRVDGLNAIVGSNLLELPDFGEADEYTNPEYLETFLSEEKYQEWYTEEMDAYMQNFEEDVNGFLAYIESTRNTKTKKLQRAALKTTKDVATIAGGVAVGVLIARALDRKV